MSRILSLSIALLIPLLWTSGADARGDNRWLEG